MSDHVRGKNIRYQEIVDAGFCYVGQKEICPKQGDPSCQNGSHACYRCWTTRNIRVMHGCYTKRNKVCKSRSPDFEHFPDRDPLDEDENVEDYDDLYDDPQDTPVDQFQQIGASRRPGFQAPRRPTLVHTQQFQQSGASSFHRQTYGNAHKNVANIRDQVGPSHPRRPNYQNESAGDSGLAKRPRLDPTVTDEDLKIKIVQMECDLKIEREKLAMKENVWQNEKLNLEMKNEQMQKRVEELEQRNIQLEKKNVELDQSIKEKTDEVEKKTRETEKEREEIKKLERKNVELEQSIKEKSDELEKKTRENEKEKEEIKNQHSTERQQLMEKNIDLELKVKNLNFQLHHLSRAKVAPTGSNMNGQVFGSASRNNIVKYNTWTCKFCTRKFSQEDMDSGAADQHLYNAHGINKQDYVNQARGLPMSGNNTGLQNYMVPGPSNGRGMSVGIPSGSRYGHGPSSSGSSSGRGLPNRLF